MILFKVFWNSIIFMAFLTILSCSGVPKPESAALPSHNPTERQEGQSKEGYVLRPEDILEIKFFYTPELNERTTIRLDGRICLQLIGEVVAAGLTPDKLTKTLKDRYGGILLDPEIAVLVHQVAERKVYVGGEVGNPRMVAFNDQLTILHALAEAGWLKKSAEPRSIVIVRNTGNEVPEVMFVDITKPLEGHNEMTPVHLRPFDLVYVPSSSVAKVGDFVEQYFDRIILTPISRIAGFSFFYNVRNSPYE